MASVTVLLLVIVILFIIKLLWANRLHWDYRIYQCVKNIPGPPCIPLVGCSIPFIGTREHLWNKFRETAAKYPEIYRLWGINRCVIIFLEPDDIELILSTSTKNLVKCEPYDFVRDWLGDGLLLSSGSKWKSRRRILTPAFHFNILNEFVDVFEENSEKTANFIKNNCNKVLNAGELAVEHTMYSLCETTMGISVNMEDPNIKQYKSALHEFGGIVYDRITKPWQYPGLLFYFSQAKRNSDRLIKEMHKFTLNVIHERLLNWSTEGKQPLFSASGKKIFPMMDLLIGEMKQGGDIDFEGIREEVDTFMFEGHDTTSTALTFLLMLLANNPDAQNRIYEEQLSIFNDSKRKATYDDLQNMDYLERCIKEALRLYPPVPLIGRTLDEDIVLKKNFTIPTGVYMGIMIYDLHRNPKYWPDPHKFDPDRFLPDNCANRHPFAYIPFSAGSRNCIGQRFAMLEMKSFASKIIREFILEPIDTPDTITLAANLIIRTKKPVEVKFRRRF
uniref:cytochrome P450 4C1-like n=1 Tax=Chrysoperla carnea TaxID=189513 RepID=UPI003B75C387